MKQTPETCSNCGAILSNNARACPECGSDESTGWKEDAYEGGLGIASHDFDYDEFVRKEFGGGEKAKPKGVSWFWWCVAVGLLLMMLRWWLRIG